MDKPLSRISNKQRPPKCEFCSNSKRPLRWYVLWSSWMCYICLDRRVEIAMNYLVVEIAREIGCS